jgi:hypothetical protein
MTDSPPSRREGVFLAGLLALSAAVLMLSIGQVRVLSFQLWHHVTYLVVTVTLLGFAAGGTYAALRPARCRRSRAALQSSLFALATIGVFAVLARHRSSLLMTEGARLPALDATFSYLYLVLPFAFGGLAVAAGLDGRGREVSRRYGVNLAGSALGCLLVFPALRFGGEGLVLLAAALGGIGATCFAIAAGSRKFAVLGALVVAIAAIAFPFRQALLPFAAAGGKALSLDLARGEDVIHTAWDSICRIDVVGDEARDPRLKVYQDGDAPTWIPSAKVNYEVALPASYHALGYSMALGTRKNVLVIGVGGGGDVKTALVMGAERVLGAEINQSTAAMMQGRFAEYSGRIYDDPRVRIEVRDGRAVVAASEEKFDLIQITGADTYAALAAGANLTAESYLYTREAIRGYLDHLTDDGVLCVLRWRFFPPRETLRLAGMVAHGLREIGAADPSRHVAVVNVKATGALFGENTIDAHYALTIVKKTPLTESEIGTIRKFVRLHPNKAAYSLAYLPGEAESEPEFRDYLTAISTSAEAAAKYERDYAFAIEPVSDDRPFFFQFFRPRSLLQAGERDTPYFHVVIGQGPAGLQVLYISLLGALALVLLFVLAPLALLRREGLKTKGALPAALFFVCVGIAYLAVEMPTVQRLTLFLGHPLKALGVGLSTFLVASGIGAALTARIAEGNERRTGAVAAFLVAIAVVLHALLLPSLFEACAPLSPDARTVVAVLAIAPLALLMGMPFPLGLRAVQRTSAPLLPWALGVNGGASVIASVGSILFAMEFGFVAVLGVAAALYAIAALLAPRPA